MTRHAVYAIPAAGAYKGERLAFRVGQPTDWTTAQLRYDRLYSRERGVSQPPRPVKIRHDGRLYRAKWFEVRAVDEHGRGLGSERHEHAIIVPYRAVRSAKKR